MTWELAVALLSVLMSHIGVEVYRHWRQRGREPREHRVLDTTSMLAVARANLAAEELEGKKLDRTERLYQMVDDLRERMQRQDDRMETLSDELDAERLCRQASQARLKASEDELKAKAKLSVKFVDHLITLVPDPQPDYPIGWDDLRDMD